MSGAFRAVDVVRDFCDLRNEVRYYEYDERGHVPGSAATPNNARALSVLQNAYVTRLHSEWHTSSLRSAGAFLSRVATSIGATSST